MNQPKAFHDPPAGLGRCVARRDGAPIPGSNRPPAWPTPPACRRRPHDHLQPVVATHQAFQYQPSTVAVLNVGDALPPPAAAPEYPPQCDVCVPLPACPRRNLAAPFFGGLHRLAVNDGSAGTGCPTLGLSKVGGGRRWPFARSYPYARCGSNGRQCAKVAGRGAASARSNGAQHVANGVYDLAPRVLHRPTAGFGRWPAVPAATSRSLG